MLLKIDSDAVVLRALFPRLLRLESALRQQLLVEVTGCFLIVQELCVSLLLLTLSASLAGAWWLLS